MERLGIYKSWKTTKTLLKVQREVMTIHHASFEKDLHQLEAYGRGENPFFTTYNGQPVPAKPPFFNKVELSISPSAVGILPCMEEVLQHHARDMTPIRHYYAYLYWKERLTNHNQLIRLHEPPIAMGTSFNFSVEVLCGCLYCGWLEQAEALAKEILIIYRHKRMGFVDGEFSHPLYHWILRICFEYWGWHFDGWGQQEIYKTKPVEDVYAPPECFSEPALNELFEHWRDPDLTPMQEHLIWLCDYYTHRTRPASGTEFGNDALHTRFPALILAWFRLRRHLGLENPRIDHPLMQPEYVRLPEPQSFYTDDLLDALLTRLRREEIPHLGEMPIEELFAMPETDKKPGLLARLFGKK